MCIKQVFVKDVEIFKIKVSDFITKDVLVNLTFRDDDYIAFIQSELTNYCTQSQIPPIKKFFFSYQNKHNKISIVFLFEELTHIEVFLF